MEFIQTAAGDGLEVWSSTEPVTDLGKGLAAALKFAADRKVVAIGAEAGGPIWVRLVAEEG